MKRRISQKAVVITLSVAMIAGLVTYGTPAVRAAGIKLSRTKASIYVGGTLKLKVKGTAKKVKWSTTKKKVAAVSSKGVVKGKAKGKTKIIAKVNSKKLICNITVKERSAVIYKATNTPIITATPVIPTAVPAIPTATPTAAPTATPTAKPTDIPGPTQTPAYMSEGAFVYEKLDTSWIDPEKPMIAFTFDDGPVGTSDTATSMRILATLKEYGMHATFNYITGEINASMSGEILKAMEQGNEIGNHTSAYDSLSDEKIYTSVDAIAAEVEKARKALEDLTGIKSFTLRPPSLGVNNDVYHGVNVPLIHCSIDSLDWNGASLDEIIANVKKAKDGDIVLMHETKETTANAIEQLVPYFVENGYQIVSVSELYAVKDIPLYPGKCYHSTTKEPTQATD